MRIEFLSIFRSIDQVRESLGACLGQGQRSLVKKIKTVDRMPLDILSFFQIALDDKREELKVHYHKFGPKASCPLPE